MIGRRLRLALLAVAVVASGCGSSRGTGPVDCTGGHVTNGGCVLTTATGSARLAADGPLWFLGGDNPGSVFGRSGLLYHLDLATARLTRLALPKRLWSVTGLAASPDGDQIALSNGGGEFPPRNLYVMRDERW